MFACKLLEASNQKNIPAKTFLKIQPYQRDKQAVKPMPYVKKHLLDQQISTLIEDIVVQRGKLVKMRQDLPERDLEVQRLRDLQDQAQQLLRERNQLVGNR